MTESRVIEGKAEPRGAYPHYKRAGDWIYVSGISARQAGQIIPGSEVDAAGTAKFDVEEQTRACIENVRDVLTAAGAGLEDLVEITTFLVDMGDFGAYNRAYARFFDAASGPARTTVAVHQLPHPHLRVEIKAIAWKPRG